MQANKQQKMLRLVESGLMLAMATVLSMVKVLDLPYGGSITHKPHPSSQGSQYHSQEHGEYAKHQREYSKHKYHHQDKPHKLKNRFSLIHRITPPLLYHEELPLFQKSSDDDE